MSSDTEISGDENFTRVGSRASVANSLLEKGDCERKVTTTCGLRLRVDDYGKAVVDRKEEGSAADLCGVVTVGDVVVKVDDQDLDTRSAHSDGYCEIVGFEGSPVRLSMSRDVPGVNGPFLYDVDLWFGKLEPNQCEIHAQNFRKALLAEERLCETENERVRSLKQRLEIDSAANRVLEARIAALREKIARAVVRGKEMKHHLSENKPWTLGIPLTGSLKL